MTKSICICFIAVSVLTGGAFAKEIVVGPQEVSPFADCEVATNIAFNAQRTDTKRLEVRLDSDVSAANSLQVAFGRDADGNGDLSPAETAFIIGRRGNRYFIEDVSAGIRKEEACARPEADRYLKLVVSTDRDFAPRTAEFECGCGSCFRKMGAEPWMFRTDWNLIKVTRRGSSSGNEWCKVDSRYRAMMMLFR